MREKARFGIYMLAGIYLETLAYSMFRNLSNSTGIEWVIVIVAMIAFALIGAVLIGAGLYSMWKGAKERKEKAAKE